MDVISIIMIVALTGGLGYAGYLYFSGKKDAAKGVLAGLTGLLIGLGILSKKETTEFKEDVEEKIENSEKEDKERDGVINNIEDQIDTNKDLLNEISETLGDND